MSWEYLDKHGWAPVGDHFAWGVAALRDSEAEQVFFEELPELQPYLVSLLQFEPWLTGQEGGSLVGGGQNPSPWGQTGTTLIDGQEVRGVAQELDRENQLVRFTPVGQQTSAGTGASAGGLWISLSDFRMVSADGLVALR